MNAIDRQSVIDATQHWIAEIVIGLNLCPFARRVFEGGLVRFVVSEAQDATTLLTDLDRELRTLATAPIAEIETTLLIHPLVFDDFLRYNDFLDAAEGLVGALGLEGVIQVASFHPRYQFAETEPDAVENYTNRSPYPMLHLLREESIDAIALDEAELLDIPRRNIETLRALGREAVLATLRAAHTMNSLPPFSS
jgi:uncharacterized protein